MVVNQVIFEDILVFSGVIVAMGCTTGIIITMLKHRRQRGLPSGELERRLEEVTDRLGRIETAIDATALEVERISENQRFTTRLLAERSGASGYSDKSRPGGSTTPH